MKEPNAGMITSVMYAVVGVAMDTSRAFQNPPTLEALLPTIVTMDQANSLFDLMPGLEYCSYDQPSG